MNLSGWGRYPVHDARLFAPRDVEALERLVGSGPSLIARGSGRAYGDSAVNSAGTVDMRHLNRMISFSAETGQLVAEAGVTIDDVLSAFLPRGWFPFVTPGTRFVTLGGAIAADVHGKNHHIHGSFRACVDWIDLMGPDGKVRRCSRDHHFDLFDHTIGGMGLTGIILRAAIRLRRVETAWIRRTTVAAGDLGATLDAFEEAHAVTYSVAWIDCLSTGDRMGRSLISLGEHATLQDLPTGLAQDPMRTGRGRRLTVPFDLPRIVLNRFSVGVFNELYYRLGKRRTGPDLVTCDSFFYPLDALRGWNRMYGRRGFLQFQCVLPLSTSRDGLATLLRETARAGLGSFLAVLKRLGQGEGALSFPLRGYTLAMDFPVTDAALRLLDRLDRITIEHGGRFYLAKDGRMSAQTLRSCDHRAEAFRAFREREGLHERFSSAQAQRLNL